jgi:dienelactone hydrolase
MIISMTKRLLTAVFFAAIFVPVVRAQDVKATLPARIDVLPFESITLSDSDFLKGDKSAAKPVIIAGHLYIAQGSGKGPAVIMLHGSAGINGGSELWAREFAQMGVSTLMVDSFSGRGIVSTLDDQSQLGRLNMVIDAYRAIDKIKTHPRVDASRIALMGFSRGGQAALLASMERFHGLWNSSGADFAAYVPFYSDCKTTFIDDVKVKPVPIRMHHGEADDYVPAAGCVTYVERLKAAGRDAQITLYKDAHHVFDSPISPAKPFVLAQAQTMRQCFMAEKPLGEIVNAKTGQTFTYADPCVERGPHVGYHAEAATAARASVRETLRAAFKL